MEMASGGVGRCSVWEALELQPPLLFLTEFPVGSRDKAGKSVGVIWQRVSDPAVRLKACISAWGYLSGAFSFRKTNNIVTLSLSGAEVVLGVNKDPVLPLTLAHKNPHRRLLTQGFPTHQRAALMRVPAGCPLIQFLSVYFRIPASLIAWGRSAQACFPLTSQMPVSSPTLFSLGLWSTGCGPDFHSSSSRSISLPRTQGSTDIIVPLMNVEEWRGTDVEGRHWVENGTFMYFLTSSFLETSMGCAHLYGNLLNPVLFGLWWSFYYIGVIASGLQGNQAIKTHLIEHFSWFYVCVQRSSLWGLGKVLGVLSPTP